MTVTVSTTNIIESALRKIGVYDAGEAIGGDEYTNNLLAFNLMAAGLVTRGVDLFTRQEQTLFLQNGQRSYDLGATSTDHCTASFVETTLSAAEASGQTAISVTSSTGMTVSDYIGIQMDDGSIHWSTIASVDSSTQVTIADATDDDAASGNKVYAYTTKAERPHNILTAYRKDTTGKDTGITLIGQEEYDSLGEKGSAGPVTQIWYNPYFTNGELKVWPVTDSNTHKLILGARVLPTTFPLEWGETLAYQLASKLGREHGIPFMEMRDLRSEAEFLLSEALAHDTENASVIFGMDG